ncbi:site-specific DNA-methyltransferase [Paenibacillus sp. 7124]|uniref:Methyltransferase n=1 Tax=Paenibacillus apii TaxID=1850370 RepID=A0A6M1PDG0_9BACL|nr:site-specific DNA-methyltransferase [Paenibacillus apii]NGM81216.1 site-specific DNA-methyltransferase [Paenibacillus apii]
MQRIPDGCVDLVVTSPPYNIGKEYEQRREVDYYISWISEVIKESARIVKPSGSVVFQLGNYVANGRVYPLDCLLFASFINQGLIPRNRIVWAFNHGLHCSKRLSGRHETLLWFTKTEEYKFNLDAIRVPQKYPGKRHYKGPRKGELSGNPLGKNPGDVWEIGNVKNNHPEKTKHPCQFPVELVSRVILVNTDSGDTVVDPFMGSGTTAVAATLGSRNFIGFETDAGYVEIANKRLADLTTKEVA